MKNLFKLAVPFCFTAMAFTAQAHDPVSFDIDFNNATNEHPMIGVGINTPTGDVVADTKRQKSDPLGISWKVTFRDSQAQEAQKGMSFVLFVGRDDEKKCADSKGVEVFHLTNEQGHKLSNVTLKLKEDGKCVISRVRY